MPFQLSTCSSEFSSSEFIKFTINLVLADYMGDNTTKKKVDWSGVVSPIYCAVLRYKGEKYLSFSLLNQMKKNSYLYINDSDKT